MRTVILCGGRGERLPAATRDRPKPLVEIGGRPLLRHVMGIYAAQGYTDFVLPLGYGGEAIRDHIDDGLPAAWDITTVDTGTDTPTAERLERVADHLGDRFMVTYADGVADVDLEALVETHEERGATGTVTGVEARVPYGVIEVEDGRSAAFREKPVLDRPVNGGFMVFESEVLERADGGMLAGDVLPELAEAGELAVHRHDGYWDSVDTAKDLRRVKERWGEDRPWEVTG